MSDRADDPFHLKIGISFSSFSASRDREVFDCGATPIAECYRFVYGTDSAWAEGRFCKICSEREPGRFRKWSLLNAPSRCPDCGTETVEFWTVSKILDDMYGELMRPDATCIVARDVTDKVVGASWGFSADAEEMEEHINHGCDKSVRAPDVARLLREQFPSEKRFAYQDEIFVRPEYQGKKIGLGLFAKRHESFKASGLRVCVMRTKMNPPAKSFLWFARGWGYRILSRFPDAEQRVILVNDFTSVDRFLQR